MDEDLNETMRWYELGEWRKHDHHADSINEALDQCILDY
jgi:hypothetical protein